MPFLRGRNKFEEYIEWKHKWVKDSRCAPTLRLFILDALLPFWISCNKCGKFRKTTTDENEWNNETIANFTCAQVYEGSNPCNVEEDKV
jgi:lysyl-tRNA synthetase class I